MSITKKPFGTMPDGTPVDACTIKSEAGLEAEILTCGGIVRRLIVPGKNGETADVAVGFDSLEGYLTDGSYQGALVGRYANRIGGAKFSLNGSTYNVTVNEGQCCLHGGGCFSHRVWSARGLSENSLELRYVSPDGENGFPGKVETTVTYTLDGNALRIAYGAVSDADTIMCFTNHTYFNLSGFGGGDVLSHELSIDADNVTPVDAASIPTGGYRSVEGTPMDFRTAKPVGRDIGRVDDELIAIGKGYDINFVINGWQPGKFLCCARACDPKSGRTMDVYTDMPGVQLYTGNFLDGSVTGKNGAKLIKNCGLCLETQYHPDSPNRPEFPSCVKKAGEVFKTVTEYRFGVK